VNPRQRRGVLLLGLAFLGAIAVFVAVASYVSSVRKNVKPEADTYVLNRPVAAQQPVLPSMLRLKRIPRKFLSERAITDPAVIGQRVAGQPIPAGAQLSEGMLVDPPAVPAGQREFAIAVSADTGVAGKIQPGDLVDLTAAFAGDQRSLPRARTIISRARIITVGVPRTRESQPFVSDQDQPASGSTAGGGTVIPVTFAFTRREVQVAEYAQAFAQEVRLSLIPADESATSKKNPNEYTLPVTKRRAPR
jgi:pilus assembly protein CpaB